MGNMETEFEQKEKKDGKNHRESKQGRRKRKDKMKERRILHKKNKNL